MSTEICYRIGCLVALDPSGQKIFGVSEFLAGLALMVLAWTTADVLYRFRIAAAPLPLRKVTFFVVAMIGILTLLTDLWRAEGWLVPKGEILTPTEWQAILGGIYIATFLTWAWYAFIKPPIYAKNNAKHFATALYEVILKGSTAELSVIADELSYSAESLVTHATDFRKTTRSEDDSASKDSKQPPVEVEAYANILLLLIANRKFCRAIVQSSPGTALAFFQAAGTQQKYGIQIESFSKNLVSEALDYSDSFLYHETDVYESGLLGYHKPLSHAMFSDSRLVEGIGTLLTPDIAGQWKWDAPKWQAYCRVVLMVFGDTINRDIWKRSSSLSTALNHIAGAVSDLHRLNEVEKYLRGQVEHEKLRVVIEFICDAVQLLNKKNIPEHLPLRISSSRRFETIYDDIARLAYSVIFSASRVKAPESLCWTIQHNYVWGELAGYKFSGPAGKVIKHKIRRLFHDELRNMDAAPNYKGASLIGYFLNVVGFLPAKYCEGHERVLKMIVRGWVKRNYSSLHLQSPKVAEACLVDGISYEPEHLRLIKTRDGGLFRKKPHIVYIQLSP